MREEATELGEQLRPRLRPQRMLPQAHDIPPGPPEVTRVAAIAFLVEKELRPPEGGVALGLRAVARTAMPEAAIDEHHEPTGAEDEVRSHPERLAPGVTPTHGLLSAPA